MRARILIDNLTQDHLIPEWGLSVHLEHGDHVILLDTGASEKFLENARTLGIDLNLVQYGVLSHAHYDHSDGMEGFFRENGRAVFYLRKGADVKCYSKKKWLPRYIGVERGLLARNAHRITYAEGDVELYPGAWLIPHKTPGLQEVGRKIGMYTREGLIWRYEDFAHEQSLVLETAAGLVICNSCSHGGAGNIIREVQETFPDRKISTYIGGLHLYRSSEEDVRALAAQIRKTGIDRVYTGHCTGQEAFAILKEELGEGISQIYTGMEITV